MSHIKTIILLTFLSCLLAGIYGILHDQLTYTISPEYYSKFKFIQFGLLDEGVIYSPSHPRLWVCYVGFVATWWLGIPVGLILSSISIQPDRKIMIEITLKSLMIVIAIAFISGLFGLYHGHFNLSDQPRSTFRGWFIPNDVVDFKNYITVGSIHNYSYLGGLYGIVGGIVYIIWRKGGLPLVNRKRG